MNDPTGPLSVELLGGAVMAAVKDTQIPYDRVFLNEQEWAGIVQRSGLTHIRGHKVELMTTDSMFREMENRQVRNFGISPHTALLIPDEIYTPSKVVFLDLAYEQTAEVEALLKGGGITVIPCVGDYQYWQQAQVAKESPDYAKLVALIMRRYSGYSGRHYLSDGYTCFIKLDGELSIYNGRSSQNPVTSIAIKLGCKVDTTRLRAAAAKDLEKAIRKEEWAAQLEEESKSARA